MCSALNRQLFVVQAVPLRREKRDKVISIYVYILKKDDNKKVTPDKFYRLLVQFMSKHYATRKTLSSNTVRSQMFSL